MTYRTLQSIIDERAKYNTPEVRERLSFIQRCERYFGASSHPAPLHGLEPWQQEMIDTLMDEARKHPVKVLLRTAPDRAARPPMLYHEDRFQGPG
jgi:hypothetical protein